MRRDAASGTLLIIAALSGVVVMSLHPTLHDVSSSETGQRMGQLNVMVHALAILSVPILFIGLLGVARRLAPSDVATAGLVAFGLGSAAVVNAAVASGFIVPGVLQRIVATQGSHVPDAFVLYTGLWNQAFAKVNVMSYSAGILLVSTAILRTGRLARAAGVYGLVVGAVVPVLLLAGHLSLDVHGFGAVTIAQGAWFSWLGVLLLRDGGPPPA